MFSFRDKLDTDIYRKILGNKTSSQMIRASFFVASQHNSQKHFYTHPIPRNECMTPCLLSENFRAYSPLLFSTDRKLNMTEEGIACLDDS